MRTEHAAPPGGKDALSLGRTYSSWFYDGKAALLWAVFNPPLRRVFGSVENLSEFRARTRDGLGAEQRAIDEEVISWLGSSIYNRTADFSREAKPVWVQWVIDEAGRVDAFKIQLAPEPAPSGFLAYDTRALLRLPFDGQRFVYWGGRTVLQNYHAVSRTQRFAYDFVVARGESTHAGSPQNNWSYYCFALPVLAAANGTVVAAVGGIPDNARGQMNERQPLGNHVVIDHGSAEYSFFAHLQAGSVNVSQGERVSAGDRLGRCGNSGRSSQRTCTTIFRTRPIRETATAWPAQFRSYCENGVWIGRGEPERGRSIREAQDGCD